MKLVIYHTILGDKIVENPKFIPRIGEQITINKYLSPKVISIIHDYGKEYIVYIETE